MRHRLFRPERLTAVRVERDLTITQLAALAGLSKDYVWRLESGRHPYPSALTVARLVRGLSGIKPCTLEDFTDPKPQTSQVAA